MTTAQLATIEAALAGKLSKAETIAAAREFTGARASSKAEAIRKIANRQQQLAQFAARSAFVAGRSAA